MHLSGLSVSEIESQYAGKGYGAFKSDLADVVVNYVSPITEKMQRYLSDLIQLMCCSKMHIKALTLRTRH